MKTLGEHAAPETAQGTILRRNAFGIKVLGAIVVASVGVGAGLWASGGFPDAHSGVPPVQKPSSRTADNGFIPTQNQWAALSVETVAPHAFRTIVSTDGRIAIDEDNTTPVFSPYAGRVIALHAKAGDKIQAGQPLFTIAATDMVQAQNDMVSAVAALNKANSALRLAEINLTRARSLYESKAGSQRDFQTAEDTRNAATSDKSAAEAAIEAARNRLKLLLKTDEEIAVFRKEGRMSAETVIPAPLSGTVVQRKAGPGLFVAGASSDPLFVIGDLSTVWIVANVKETDAPAMEVGQKIEFRVLALPGKSFSAKIDYVASTIDPVTRRLTVRAAIPNPDGKLKPESFAGVDIVTSGEQASPSISRGALIYDGEAAHVWAVRADKSIVKQAVVVGNATTDRVEVLKGITNGDKLVAKGSLFIDRVASSGE